MSRLDETFAALRAAQKTGLVAYVTAGDPDLARSAEVIRAVDRGGADVIELGGPFSDPLADGPVIQRATERALAAGFKVGGHPRGIGYTAEVFDREALALVVELGVHCNCGSPDMLEQLGRVAPGSEITLRINPGFGHGHSQKTNTGGAGSKHGIWHTQIANCIERGAKYDITITGLHMHLSLIHI